MDFSRFDNRTKAETGSLMQALDPDTREPVVTPEGKPCGVIVRGVASRTIQQQIREKARARMAEKAKAKKAGDDIEEARIACMEDLHETLIEAATPFIAGFENIERNGKPLTNSPEDVRWFLDLSFPFMDVEKDENGNPVLTKDGTPKFEMTNLPFAKQVDNFAADQKNYLGNGKTA